MLGELAVLESIFKLGNQLALLGWIILLFLPRTWKIVVLVPTIIIPLLLSLAYGGIMFVVFFQGNGGDFSSLAGVKQLFTQDEMVLAGWLHYLAFDLFIGGVIACKADEIRLSRIIQLPILLLTFLAGPIGFFLFQCTYGGWSLFSKKLFHHQQGATQ